MKTPMFIYGTTNPAKLAFMRGILSPLPVRITGIREIGAVLPDVKESGASTLENARLKALAYYQALEKPVFACDSGLIIEGLPDAEQPGVHVRFVNGRHLTDSEMTAHYAAIASRLGGRAVARYQNAICLITADGKLHEHTGDDIAGEAFYFLSVPHEKRVPGFPLDCLSARIDNSRYYYDCADTKSIVSSQAEGFRTFFRMILAQI